MLIDTFAPDWIDNLRSRENTLQSGRSLYLLIDGAFVPGVHKMIERHDKALLFEELPACSEDAKDVSPFLTRLDLSSRRLVRLLKRCNRWPMVSLVETPETLPELAARLGPWCIVEADGQRFNFRFSDTRRLPAVLRTLHLPQRGHFVGPAVRWSYVSRDGEWRDLPIEAPVHAATAEPVRDQILDQEQFAALVEDSLADETLAVLAYRGHEPYRRASRGHALLTAALSAAAKGRLETDEVIDWCEWYWGNDEVLDAAAAVLKLSAWRNTLSNEARK